MPTSRTRSLGSRLLCFAFLALPCLAGCYGMRPSSGGAQVESAGGRSLNAADIALPPGYRIEAVASGLTFPTGVTFDDAGRPYVVEAGYSYGEAFATPRLLRVGDRGEVTVVAEGEKVAGGTYNGPWTGAVFHQGNFYVAEGGEAEGGRILRISPDGKQTVLIDHLPSMGDHHTDGPAIGPDGMLYFGVGTATNSGVVGTDNFQFGWAKRHPEFHDIPGRDITLAGQNFTTPDPRSADKDAKAVTGAYVPFGTATTAGQVIKGQVPCTGAILRIPLNATTQPAAQAEVVAWGLRNPFGLAFGPDGKLFVTENQFDDRGSRPVWGTGDLLWRIDTAQPALWYGWPDFFGGLPLTRSNWFKAHDKEAPKFLLANHPNDPPKPAAWFGVHSSSDGLDFSQGAFGFPGDAFVAQFGDMSPGAGKLLAPVGFKVVRVNPTDGVIHDFAVNRGKENGPASKLKAGGLERPVACRFDPSGAALYVVDFGVLTEDDKGNPHPRERTGVLWKITRTGG